MCAIHRTSWCACSRLYTVPDFERRAKALIEELELTGKERSRPAELSRGMRQKVVIACGLVRDASVLRSSTNRRTKITLPGPFTLAQQAQDDFYGDVEAMAMDVPVLAYGASAVPGTLGGAGVQFAEKSVGDVAELAYRLATDETLRAPVLEGQRRRLEAFAPPAVESALRGYVESL